MFKRSVQVLVLMYVRSFRFCQPLRLTLLVCTFVAVISNAPHVNGMPDNDIISVKENVFSPSPMTIPNSIPEHTTDTVEPAEVCTMPTCM